MIIGMDHHNHIGPAIQRLAITGLLVGSIATILLVDDHSEIQAPGQFHCFVGAVIVHQNAVIDYSGEFAHSGFQRLGRVVRRQDHGNPFASN